MLNVGVLISGRGSNLQALINAAQKPDYPAKIVCVISNKADAGGLDKARAAGIPAFVVDHRQFLSKEEFIRHCYLLFRGSIRIRKRLRLV
jgi:phosphoribosylglycinamide formyltransferase-1